ncbi:MULTISPECIES: hypothetical protein [Haloarcula]|uniref:hypothetical protein n=1 Tax=Haloarcula TaxID=2237 RepID=UPI0023EDB44F|nr:hypothetical protein [Halomicroarcula sp. XH51]
MSRALLTDREREIIAGEAEDVEHPKKYQANTRARVRKRLERIEEDLSLLDEHEPGIADQLREKICEGSQQEKMHEVLDDIQADIQELKEEHNT